MQAALAFEAYEKFCRVENLQPWQRLNNKAFYAAMEQSFKKHKVREGAVRAFYLGVGLKADETSELRHTERNGPNPMDDFLSDHARSVLLPNRRCTATSRSTGERCGRASALGQFVCDKHGAKAPLSIQAAKERMAILVEPAMEVLYRATRSAPPCEHCGRSDADRDPTAVRAAQIILDRTGHHPTLTLTQEPTPTNPLEDLTDDELIDHYERVLEEFRASRELGRQRSLPQPEVKDVLLLDAYEVPAEDDAIRSTPPEKTPMKVPNA